MKKIEDFLPDTTKVISKVKEAWDWQSGFPIPTFDIKCPVCGSKELLIRYWTFFIRKEGSSKFRCDVSFKCTYCSNAWVHGLVIPEELFRLHCIDYRGRRYLWKEVKDILRG